MITLYHGTTIQLTHPLANVGREELYFGRGFYLTSLHEQAEQALGQLRYTKPNHQICLLNQSVIDKYLHYTTSFLVGEERKDEGL